MCSYTAGTIYRKEEGKNAIYSRPNLGIFFFSLPQILERIKNGLIILARHFMIFPYISKTMKHLN